jgi:hypothetical protein
MVGGTVLSALVHLWFYVLADLELAAGDFLTEPESFLAGRSK